MAEPGEAGPACERTLPPPLGQGRVHVWTVALDGPAERPGRLGACLSPDETTRARRFHFEVHRRRFTVARGALRHLLGAYLRRSPESLVFRYGHRGKPELPEAPELSFNLSHSEERALLAVSHVAALGVDIERLRPMDDMEAIARRFFSPPEHAALMALAPGERVAGFFRCWTRKEAYLKAVGEGLAIPLRPL